MKFRQALKVSSLCCFAGMVVGGYFASFLFTVWLRLDTEASLQFWLTSPLSALVVFLFASGFAVLPVVVLGWPGYAWLIYRGRASYVSALAIAAGAALAAWVYADPGMAEMVGFFGACIAIATHAALPKAAELSGLPLPGKL